RPHDDRRFPAAVTLTNAPVPPVSCTGVLVDRCRRQVNRRAVSRIRDALKVLPERFDQTWNLCSDWAGTDASVIREGPPEILEAEQKSKIKAVACRGLLIKETRKPLRCLAGPCQVLEELAEMVRSPCRRRAVRRHVRNRFGEQLAVVGEYL